VSCPGVISYSYCLGCSFENDWQPGSSSLGIWVTDGTWYKHNMWQGFETLGPIMTNLVVLYTAEINRDISSKLPRCHLITVTALVAPLKITGNQGPLG
jgi:hypothetical protein